MTPMAAHMFIFYFGAFVVLDAAGRGAELRRRGTRGRRHVAHRLAGMQAGLGDAYLLPFLWAYDPAILMDGSPLAIVLVFAAAVGAILLFARGIQVIDLTGGAGTLTGMALFAAALAVGTSPIWLGADSVLNLVPALGAIAVYAFGPGKRRVAGALVSREVGSGGA